MFGFRKTPADPRQVVVTVAADDGYAMPLAVTVRSVLETLDPQRRLTLYVLDGGLSPETKLRLLRSWNDSRLTVHWIDPDVRRVRDLTVSDHVNVVTYLRLLMPLVLPKEVTRTIYLDADMLVRRDLGALWDEPQAGHAVLAAPCLAAPAIDAEKSLPSFPRCRKYLAAHTPIANYRELGLDGGAAYFNGGLLVVDLEQWRRRRLAEAMLDCLRRHRQYVQWWDQYALNVVLARDWGALDLRWNQGAHLFCYPSWKASPFDRETFRQLCDDPWIVHYCSPAKPWHYVCRHPYAGEFRRTLALTDWNGWRPDRPSDFWRQWWRSRYRPAEAVVRYRLREIRGALRRAA